MKTLLCTLALTFGLMASVMCSGTAQASHANVSSGYAVSQIEIEIRDFYANFGNEDLTTGDRNEFALAIAETLGGLEPQAFNDVVGNVLADYYSVPELRPAVELLMDAASRDAVVSHDLVEQDEKHPALMVINDVIQAWSLAYTVGFGKGVITVHGKNIIVASYRSVRHPIQNIKSLWASRGRGLPSAPSFKQALQTYSEHLPTARRHGLAITGVGTAAGVTHLVLDYLATHRLDPRKRLQDAQRFVIQNLGIRAAAAHDRVIAYRTLPQVIEPKERARLEKLVQNTFSEADLIKKQVTHLYVTAPFLKSRMSLVLEDSETARSIATRLRQRLEMLELEDASRGIPSLP